MDRGGPGQNQARDLLASALRNWPTSGSSTEPRRGQADVRTCDRDRPGAVEDEPDSEPFQHHLATALDDLGGVAKLQGRTEEARKLFGQAERIFAELVARDPESLEPRIPLLHTRYNAAMLNLDESRYKEALATLIWIRDDVRALRRDGRIEGQPWPFADETSVNALIQRCETELRMSG